MGMAAKRARIRQEECDEAIRQIHLLRDEMESVGDRAEELLAKLISMMGCGASTTDMVWIQRLVQEAVAAQQHLLAIIEANEIDWQTKQHNQIMDDEDAEEEGGEEESSGEEDEDEDDAGVRVGRFGKLEVVADEDMGEEEEGAETFDQEEYRRAMAALRQGKMAADDLKGMQFDRKA